MHSHGPWKPLVGWALLAAALILPSAVEAQMVNSDFSWVNAAPGNSNATTFSQCTSPLVVTLSTMGATHLLGFGGTEAFIGGPSNTNLALPVQVQLDFSAPVTNLSLEVFEVDLNGGGPFEEFLDAFTPFPDAATPDLVLSGGTSVRALADNAVGSMTWNPSLSSVAFTYNRADLAQGIGLSMLSFQCPAAVPTLPEWGLILLGVLLLSGAVIVLGAQRGNLRAV